MTMDVPLLRSSPLTVRPVDHRDVPGIARAGRDAAIRSMPWFGPAFEEAWAASWVERAMENWRSQRHFMFSVLNASEDYVGGVGVSAPQEGAIEASYWILPEERGRGIASQALEVVLEWTRLTYPEANIWAKTRPENLASRRVLLKAKFVETDRAKVVRFRWCG